MPLFIGQNKDKKQICFDAPGWYLKEDSLRPLFLCLILQQQTPDIADMPECPA